MIMDFQEVWEAHEAQRLVLDAIFVQGKKIIFLECGRKFGKTDFVNFILHRFICSVPNSAGYFIAPLLKQAKELIWANNRIQNFFYPNINPETGLTIGGRDPSLKAAIFNELREKYYAGDPNNSEMRIRMNNQGFIKLDGSDSYEAYRGVNPHIICYDEFKDHHPKFHDGMDPNLATYNAILVVVGTPPEGDEPNAQGYWDLAQIAKNDPQGAHFNFSSYSNPHISKTWLDNKKKQLISIGKEDVWLREYMAKRVRSGSNSIFPMFEGPDEAHNIRNTKHYRPTAEIRAEVQRKRKDWEFWFVLDPASSSVFGGVFAAINRYDKRVRILEEIYETRKGHMGTKEIFGRVLSIVNSYNLLASDVRYVYDHAEAWFPQEVSDHFEEYDIGLEPCIKDRGKEKDDRLNTIKEMLLYGKEPYLVLSDSCPKTAWELQNYRTDENGKVTKENDHTIDCLRYLLNNSYYSFKDVAREKSESESGWRAFTPEQDRARDRIKNEPFSYITEDLYE